MLSSRTLASLAQFLAIQETDVALVLLGKHGIRASVENGALLTTLNRNLAFSDKEKALPVLEEIARPGRDLRVRITPRYRYDERFNDLNRCLQLDGYLIENNSLVRLDPSMQDGHPLDDDLDRELKKSGLPETGAIVDKINASAESFRATPANYNACLNDVRVALETLASSIVRKLPGEKRTSLDLNKWGSVLSYLRTSGFITQEEERGLAGVYGFVSPGSHKPLGLSEEELARLGRLFALGMCWFLVKRYLGSQ